LFDVRSSPKQRKGLSATTFNTEILIDRVKQRILILKQGKIRFAISDDFCRNVYIERAWKDLILYDHQSYKQICQSMIGGYLDRPSKNEYGLIF
jgi:hypothetical protein